MWLRAAPGTMRLQRCQRRVDRWEDISGKGNHAFACRGERSPEFVPDALSSTQGKQGALDFTGRCVLSTLPFASPLPQPLTIMLVARANGDVTLCDSLSPHSSRLELCHGYPAADAVSRNAPHVCMTATGSGGDVPGPSHLLRGRTRATDVWHIYTAIFDGDKSELYMDGIREAGGKSVGRSPLDGLRIGCDHTATFFLKGAIAELRVFSCHLSPSLRAQLEAAMGLRYGLHTANTEAAVPLRLRRATSG